MVEVDRAAEAREAAAGMLKRRRDQRYVLRRNYIYDVVHLTGLKVLWGATAVVMGKVAWDWWYFYRYQRPYRQAAKKAAERDLQRAMDAELTRKVIAD